MRLIAADIQAQLGSASWIRRMFEAGLELKRRAGPENVCDFSLGNPDLPPPPAVAEALRACAGREPLSLGYMPNAGAASFRAALARRLSAEQGVALEPRHVVATCGAAGALTALFRATLEAGDEIVCPAPYFVEYGAYGGHFGGVLRPVPMQPPAFDLDPAALDAAIGPRTRAVLVNSPNNPTGCIYGAAVLEDLAARLARRNRDRERPIFLVADEPYRFLAYDGAAVPPVLPLSPFAIAIGSFSKRLSLAGERVGYLAASPAMPDGQILLDAVTLTNRTLGFVNAPVIGQAVAEAALDSGVDVGVYDRRRQAMAGVLCAAGIEFAMPRGAFYVFPRAPGGDDQAFVRLLVEERILAVPGEGFGCPGFFRLCFCVDEAVIRRAGPGLARAAERARRTGARQ
jgi:aspartate aminotransferase